MLGSLGFLCQLELAQTVGSGVGPSPLLTLERAMTVTGKCLCGAVRWESLEPPIVTRVCWCRDCQYLGAGSGTVGACFRTAVFKVTGDTRASDGLAVRVTVTARVLRWRAEQQHGLDAACHASPATTISEPAIALPVAAHDGVAQAGARVSAIAEEAQSLSPNRLGESLR